MNLILSIPLGIRVGVVFAVGIAAGSLANLAIYGLAWHPRSISPWGRADPKVPPRHRRDRLPIVGWLGLRRERHVHGPGFWLRPMLLELLSGLGLAALYWWEIGRQGLLPPDAPPYGDLRIHAIFHAQFAAHSLLLWLMLVASAIDLDEKVIPDKVTVPGTLLGLTLAAALPYSLLPGLVPPLAPTIRPEFWRGISADSWPFLQLISPRAWQPAANDFLQSWSVAFGLGCWWLWCAALMPRSWYTRHGLLRAVQLSLARTLRQPATYGILVMGAIGSLGILAVWRVGERHWVGLISALVGMAASGGLVWLVRAMCSAALKREAMGFGDVTLMAMIGTFLGWQTCVVVFFVAPFFALAFGLARLILWRDRELPYGPFLCLAATSTIVFWAKIWDRTLDVFAMGWLLPIFLLGCIAMMPVMLWIYRLILSFLR